MAVTRTLSRVRDGLEAVFTQRSAPDDQVEFDASLMFLQMHAESEDAECSSTPVLSIWVALGCPEIGRGAKSTCQVVVPLSMLEDAEEVEQVGNDLWDSLQSHRALKGVEADLGTDHPDGE